MAWLKTLVDTYEVHEKQAGIVKNDQPVLLPVYHSTFQAQIEVAISENGDFVMSKKVEKGKDAVTIIPVTEDSAAKANGIIPHPLCDKLCYLAGDYSIYTGESKEDYFQKYMEQLKYWADTEDAHFMVKAVYKYLSKKSLICDLVNDGTLKLDVDGRLTDTVKIQNDRQTEANVRFIVYGEDIQQEAAVWKNHELYAQYIKRCREKLSDTDLCYVSGELAICSDKHPSKIRNSGDKAKLISGNDKSGFTYRGRFTTKNQVAAVGYETSQKAHNALRWLLQKQGYTRDDSAIVCWMINRDMQLPDIMQNSLYAYNNIEEFKFDFDNIWEYPDNDLYDTGKEFALQFNRAVNGYAARIRTADKVAVIALDAATTGRLSIVYYDEMGAKQYMDAVLNWQEHCKWKRSILLKKSDSKNRRITIENTPAPRDMALSAFGVQRNEYLDADKKVIRATIKRLLPCITKKGVKIPQDIIKSAARRASMPESMNSFIWWNDVLCVACAMIRFNYEEGEKTMDSFLADHMDDRNVLFGRLLAIYDYMEQRAMFERGENGSYKEQRMTNAKRYWNAFSNRPARTSKTIKQNLISYEKKLSDFEMFKFEGWTGEIMIHLADGGFDNKPLSELYLPGYYMQMEYMKSAFKKKEQ